MSKKPSITVCVPCYNEEKNIEKCLSAIFSQNFPKERLKVLVVDNGSTDKTVAIAKKFPVKILYNRVMKDSQFSKMIGFKNSFTDLFIYIDADIEIVGKNWLLNLVKPLEEKEEIVASFGRFIPNPKDSPVGRYLRYHPLELDPVFQFFCTSIEGTVIEKKRNYWICRFVFPKIPPIGICLYRIEKLRPLLKDQEKFMDVDISALLAKNGNQYFAYVPSSGFYHENIKSIFDLPKRRLRNIQKNFLPNLGKREYQYFDINDPYQRLKIIFWIIYANLFLPALLVGIWKCFKYRTWVMLYEPLAAIIVTDAIIFGFLKNRLGRMLIKQFLGISK